MGYRIADRSEVRPAFLLVEMRPSRWVHSSPPPPHADEGPNHSLAFPDATPPRPPSKIEEGGFRVHSRVPSPSSILGLIKRAGGRCGNLAKTLRRFISPVSSGRL